MPATQISFAAFALSQQAATDCTPPAQPLPGPSMDAGLVTQPSVGGGECTVPCVNEWSAAQWSRRLARQRAVSAARSVPRWGVEYAGVVRLFYSRARAFNTARSHSSYRFVGACA